jgi:hypothetical protein
VVVVVVVLEKCWVALKLGLLSLPLSRQMGEATKESPRSCICMQMFIYAATIAESNRKGRASEGTPRLLAVVYTHLTFSSCQGGKATPSHALEMALIGSSTPKTRIGVRNRGQS